MNRLYALATLLFFTVGPFWYGYVIHNGLQHPEIWSDWNHDPQLYLPVTFIVLPACGLLLWWEAHQLQKDTEDWLRMP